MQCDSNKPMTSVFGWLNLGWAIRFERLNGSVLTWNVTAKLSHFCWKVLLELRVKGLRTWVKSLRTHWFQAGDAPRLFPSAVTRQALVMSTKLPKGFATKLPKCSEPAGNSEAWLQATLTPSVCRLRKVFIPEQL